MIVKDGQRLERDRRLKASELETDKARLTQAQNSESLAAILDDPETKIVTEEKAVGRVFTEKEFEKKLLRCNPNFRFFRGKYDTSMKYIGVQTPDGMEYATCYPADFIMEHSLMKVVEEPVRDFSIGNPHLDNSPRISRKDVEEAIDKARKNGEPVQRTQAMGWKILKRPDIEVSRGWRTVLLRLLMDGWVTLAAVEKEFGFSDDRNWQEKTGRRQQTLPY